MLWHQASNSVGCDGVDVDGAGCVGDVNCCSTEKKNP